MKIGGGHTPAPIFSNLFIKAIYKNVENLLKPYPSKKEFCEKKVKSY